MNTMKKRMKAMVVAVDVTTNQQKQMNGTSFYCD